MFQVVIQDWNKVQLMQEWCENILTLNSTDILRNVKLNYEPLSAFEE